MCINAFLKKQTRLTRKTEKQLILHNLLYFSFRLVTHTHTHTHTHTLSRMLALELPCGTVGPRSSVVTVVAEVAAVERIRSLVQELARAKGPPPPPLQKKQSA